MAGELILDTGALVSLLDPSQKHHKSCVRFFEAWEGAIVSTEAVLTEASHLLGRARRGREACLDFFIRGASALAPPTANSLRRCRALLEKYADLPMDYADSTLVALAEELDTNLVFTTDRRDFQIYRLGRRRFRVLPD